MNFGETLNKLRAQAQLTQAALADKAGLSLRTVQAWEQGRRSPVSPDFFKLVKALGVAAEAFAACADGSAAARKGGKDRGKPETPGGKKPRGRGKGK
jgi:transcriptional regulator with XRE-family HTH domain